MCTKSYSPAYLTGKIAEKWKKAGTDQACILLIWMKESKKYTFETRKSDKYEEAEHKTCGEMGTSEKSGKEAETACREKKGFEKGESYY